VASAQGAFADNATADEETDTLDVFAEGRRRGEGDALPRRG
jgi:hypothetical protein